eukprot:gene1610-1781_t
MTPRIPEQLQPEGDRYSDVSSQSKAGKKQEACRVDDRTEWFSARSLETAEVHKDWRRANVTPIYKKGPKHKTENYRPGSVLGPTLVILFNNEGITTEILKFANDTKLFQKVSNSEEAFTIQEDLHKLYHWPVDRQMLFNASKCKTIHIGFNNMKYDYFIEEELVSSASEEKDLGLLINDSLSPRTRCAKAVKSGNKILGIINRTYENKT